MWTTILDFHSGSVLQIELPDMEEQSDAEIWLKEHEHEYGFSLGDSQYMITEDKPNIEEHELQDN